MFVFLASITDVMSISRRQQKFFSAVFAGRSKVLTVKCGVLLNLISAVGTFDVCSNVAVNSDLSCFLYTLQRQTEAAAFALLGRCSGVTMVISARWQKHLFPLPPTALICHCPLFRGVGVRASGMRATAAVKQQLID